MTIYFKIINDEGKPFDGSHVCFAFLGYGLENSICHTTYDATRSWEEIGPWHEFWMKIPHDSEAVYKVFKDNEDKLEFMNSGVTLIGVKDGHIGVKIEEGLPYFKLFTLLKLFFKVVSYNRQNVISFLHGVENGLTVPEAMVFTAAQRHYHYAYPFIRVDDKEKAVAFLKSGSVDWDSFHLHAHMKPRYGMSLPHWERLNMDDFQITSGQCPDNPQGYRSPTTSIVIPSRVELDQFKQLLEKQIYV